MRFLLICAALLVASPAAAKIWVDEGCFMAVESIPGTGFVLFWDDDRPKVTCTVYDWPITSPIAILQCDDGSMPEMQVPNDETLVIEDVVLMVPTDENGLCD